MEKQKNLTIWFAVNKSGFVVLYLNEPKRNTETGKWESDSPFVNSVLYKQIVELVNKAGITWNDDPNCVAISV